MRSDTPVTNATAVVVRNGRTIVKNISIEQRNSAAPVLYLQVFNTNAPTVGTTAPIIVMQSPAGNANLDVNQISSDFQGPLGGFDFSTGLSYAATTTFNGSTNPTAGQEPRVTMDYNQIGA